MTETIAQIVGIFAAAANILSYQCKDKKKLILMQLLGGSLFSINFLLLGAIMGAIMNVLAVIRAVLFINKEKWKIPDNLLVYGFIGAFLAAYVVSFTLLGTEPTVKNFILESLPVIGMTAITVSFKMKNATAVRFLALTLGSPSWLVYNIFAKSIGAIFCEAFSIVSVAIGIFRLDIKKAKKEDKTAQ